jgi:hypothetical protein
MPRSMRIAAVGVVAATILGSAILATVVRTFTSQSVVQSAYVVWNDQQLVVFVLVGRIGVSATVLQQVRSHVSRPLGIRYVFPEQRGSVFTTVLRFEEGAWQPRTEVPLEPGPELLSLGRDPALNFVNGWPLVPGGLWNGREIELLGPGRATRRRSPPYAAMSWHAAWLLETATATDVRISTGREAMTLRAARSEAQVAIDLIRDGTTPRRVLEVDLRSRPISRREFESIYSGKLTIRLPRGR